MTIVSRMLERSSLPKGQNSLVRNLTKGPSGRQGLFAHVAAFWDASLNAIAPLGYEDEAGFHYGLPPSKKVWSADRNPPSAADLLFGSSFFGYESNLPGLVKLPRLPPSTGRVILHVKPLLHRIKGGNIICISATASRQCAGDQARFQRHAGT